MSLHNQWKQIRKLQAQDEGVTEHESLCKMIMVHHKQYQLKRNEKIPEARNECALLRDQKNQDVKK